MPQVIRSLSARPYLLFVAALITVTALLAGTTDSFSASSLKVISPNGGQSYAVGQSVNIKWAKGNGGTKVKVTLIKGGKGYLVITKKTKNDGKLTWKVSSKLKAGSNYKIKIQSLSDTKVSDTSNKPFKITKAKSTKAKDTKTATFKVTQPKRGKKYKTGKKMAIRWVKGAGTYVKITLLKGKTTTTIHKKTKNDGKHTYTIPTSIKAGKTYKVKICSTKSTKSCATSKAFTISKGTTKSTIKVTYPNGAEELEQGSTHVIKYTKNDNAGKFVKIQLTRVKAGKDKGFRYLAKKTKNTGKYSWKIPTTNKYPVGSKYKIKVMAFKGGNKINDLSDKTFSIVAASSDDSTGDDGTGGGSTGGGTGGGNEGGGNKDDGTQGGGKEGDGKGNDPALPDTDPEEPGGGKEGDGQGGESTITITSPASGQTFASGETVTIAWEATGAAADMDVCLKVIDPSGTIAIINRLHINLTRRYNPSFVLEQASIPAGGRWRAVLWAFDRVSERCWAPGVHFDANHVGAEVILVEEAVAPPQPVCGNGVVEEGERCDHSGVACLIEPPTAGIPRYDVSRVTSGKWYKSGGSCERECTLLIPSSRFVREIVHDDVTKADFCDRSNGPANTFCDVEDLFYDRTDGNPFRRIGVQMCSATVKCNDTSSNQLNCAGGKP